MDSQGYTTVPIETAAPPQYLSPGRETRPLYATTQVTDAPTYARAPQPTQLPVQVMSPTRTNPVYANAQPNQGQFYVETTTKVYY